MGGRREPMLERSLNSTETRKFVRPLREARNLCEDPVHRSLNPRRRKLGRQHCLPDTHFRLDGLLSLSEHRRLFGKACIVLATASHTVSARHGPGKTFHAATAATAVPD